MKKAFVSKLSLILALAMLMSCVSIPALAEGEAVFAVGDTVNGFTVTEVGEFALVGAQTVLLEHDKTGALVLLVMNEDINRTFDISFVTPTENDKGIPHVFEHSTLDGSKKYPSESLFFNLSYQTYNTYMNAFTTDVMTSYPVASLSEKQLLKYADYYLDSCFNPMIYENENIFAEEAWRYSLADESSPLTLAGTVYSEMQGAMTLQSQALLNYAKAMYPGSVRSYQYGGLPTEIPSMTWEELKDYHTRYYHPSNSMTILYGALEDPAAFLALMDGYFSAYEKKEFVHDDPAYTPITAPVEIVCDYSVEQGAETAAGTIIYYGFVCEDATEDEIQVLDLLSSMLDSKSSILSERLYEVLPSASFSTQVDVLKPEASFVFTVVGASEQDAPVLKETILSALKETAETGFAAEELDMIMANVALDVRLLSESSSIGTDLIPNIPYFWAGGKGVHGYQEAVDNLDNFRVYADEGRYAEVINKFLTADNQRTAFVITRSVPGLKEEQDAELSAKLAEIKNGMSEAEIKAIVENTEALAMGDMSDDASVYVQQLQAETVESLPEEKRIYEMDDRTDERGIRYISARANVDGIGQTYILLDASAIAQEDIHWFKLYVDLLGELDTTAHNRTQVLNLIGRYFYNPTVKVSVLDKPEGGYNPYLRATWTAIDADMPACYDLLYELLFDTQFNDAQAIQELITGVKIDTKMSMDQESYSLQIYRAYAQSENNPSFAYYDYATGISYYQFLDEAAALLEADPEAALTKLSGVQETLKNATNAVFGFVGSEESAAVNETSAQTFVDRLPFNPVVSVAYDVPRPSPREAIVVDSAVNYNLVFADYATLELDGYNGAMDAVAALVSDGLLYPLLRDQYGAYGVIHGMDENGVYIISYRDPNIAETFAVYNMLPALVQQLPFMLDQSILDGYILATYSYHALSEGELSGGIAAISDVIEGNDPSRALQWMKDLKNIKVEDLSAYAALYQKLVQNGVMSTSGAQSAIDAMPEGTYDVIIKP